MAFPYSLHPIGAFVYLKLINKKQVKIINGRLATAFLRPL